MVNLSLAQRPLSVKTLYEYIKLCVMWIPIMETTYWLLGNLWRSYMDVLDGAYGP